MYNRNLEEDVKDDVSGYFKRLLVSLMTGNRLENQPADYNKAIQQAKVNNLVYLTKKIINYYIKYNYYILLIKKFI